MTVIIDSSKVIAKAVQSDLDMIDEMFENCKKHLINKGIFQWDEHYPNREYYHYSIEDEELYVLKIDEIIKGAIVLNEWQSPEWEEINWLETEGKQLVLHAFCIDPKAQGQGLGAIILSFAEKFAKEHGYRSIRLDAFSGNADSCRFYEKRGYQIRGEVYFSSKPEGHQKYLCFEKVL